MLQCASALTAFDLSERLSFVAVDVSLHGPRRHRFLHAGGQRGLQAHGGLPDGPQKAPQLQHAHSERCLETKQMESICHTHSYCMFEYTPATYSKQYRVCECLLLLLLLLLAFLLYSFTAVIRFIFSILIRNININSSC